MRQAKKAHPRVRSGEKIVISLKARRAMVLSCHSSRAQNGYNNVTAPVTTTSAGEIFRLRARVNAIDGPVSSLKIPRGQQRAHSSPSAASALSSDKLHHLLRALSTGAMRHFQTVPPPFQYQNNANFKRQSKEKQN